MYYLCSVDEREQSTLLNLKTHNTTIMTPATYLRKVRMTDTCIAYIKTSVEPDKPEHEFINLVIPSRSSFSCIANEFSDDIKSVVNADGTIKKPYCHNKKSIFMPLYGYKHSGMCVNRKPFGCHWDSGILGYIEIDKQTVRDTFNCSRINDKIKEKINIEIDNFLTYMDCYLNGDIYEIILKHDDVEDVEIYTVYGYENVDSYLETLK